MIAPRRQVGFRAMVRAECANLCGSRCILGEGPCPVLQTPPERCDCGVGPFGGQIRTPYFEKVVLPLAKRRAEYADAPAEYFAALAKTERKRAGSELRAVGLRDRAAAEALSTLPGPDCGGPRLRRRRTCEACASKRRRESYRREKARQRRAPAP